MKKIDHIAEQIEALSEADFAKLREWILAKDAEAWERKLEADVQAGRLDALGAAARRAHQSGDTSEL